MKEDKTKHHVRKFNLDMLEERLEYEEILNNPKYCIYRDVHTYDKFGHSLLTIWYTEETE